MQMYVYKNTTTVCR